MSLLSLRKEVGSVLFDNDDVGGGNDNESSVQTELFIALLSSDAVQQTICKGCNSIVSDFVIVPYLEESSDLLQPMSAAVGPPQHHDHCNKPEDRSTETDVTVYGFVGVEAWSSNTATATILQDAVV